MKVAEPYYNTMIYADKNDRQYELGIVLENGELYSGFITNQGCTKQRSIKYNRDFDFCENLISLLEIIDEQW